MTPRIWLLALLATTGITQTGSQAVPQSFDVLIRNGTVIDGTGERGRRTDIGILGDRIVFIGSAGRASAKSTIDATNLVVAPGFIDVHSHTEVSIRLPERHLNEGVIRQGVTTIKGMFADIAIFDPKTIRDRSTWDEPQKLAEGVVHVIVNGELVIHDGKLTGKAPGKSISKPLK